MEQQKELLLSRCSETGHGQLFLWFRALGILLENSGLIPPPTWWLITLCNARPLGFDTVS